MQRSKWFAVALMAVLLSGSYMFGRYHGSTEGPMQFPSIQVKWDSSEEPQEAKVQEVDFVEISNAMCSGEALPAEVLGETEVEKEVEESKDEESDDKTAKQ